MCCSSKPTKNWQNHAFADELCPPSLQLLFFQLQAAYFLQDPEEKLLSE